MRYGGSPIRVVLAGGVLPVDLHAERSGWQSVNGSRGLSAAGNSGGEHVKREGAADVAGTSAAAAEV